MAALLALLFVLFGGLNGLHEGYGMGHSTPQYGPSHHGQFHAEDTAGALPIG